MGRNSRERARQRALVALSNRHMAEYSALFVAFRPYKPVAPYRGSLDADETRQRQRERNQAAGKARRSLAKKYPVEFDELFERALYEGALK